MKSKKIDLTRFFVSLLSLIGFASYIIYLIITFGTKPDMPEIIGDLLIGGTPMLLATVFSVISYKYKSRLYPVLILLSYLLISIIDLAYDTDIGIYNIRIFHHFIDWHYELNVISILIFLIFVALTIYLYDRWLVIVSGILLSLVSISSFIVCYIDGYRFASIYILSITSFLLGVSVSLFYNNIKDDNDILQLLDRLINSDEMEDNEYDVEDDSDFVQSMLAVEALFYPNKENVDALVFYEGLKNRNWASIQHLFNEEYALEFAKNTDKFLKDYFSRNKINEINDDCLRIQYALESFILNGRSSNVMHDLFRIINYKTDFSKNVDIKFNSQYGELSNFTSNSFEFDGTHIESMEGFLQGLKFKNLKKQHKLFSLSEHKAKKAGQRNFYWNYCSKLYYNGKKIDRFSNEYIQLITKAYNAMAEQNPLFIDKLLSTGDAKLTHLTGKCSKHNTVLTQEEYISQMYRLREKYKREKK